MIGKTDQGSEIITPVAGTPNAYVPETSEKFWHPLGSHAGLHQHAPPPRST
jgi:hypothetical protein